MGSDGYSAPLHPPARFAALPSLQTKLPGAAAEVHSWAALRGWESTKDAVARGARAGLGERRPRVRAEPVARRDQPGGGGGGRGSPRLAAASCAPRPAPSLCWR